MDTMTTTPMKSESGGRIEADSNVATTTSATQAVVGTETDSSTTASVKATYRQLPDEDVNWLTRNNTSVNTQTVISTMKQNESTEVQDGAQEQMLNDNVKFSITPSKHTSEAQYKSENGDTKIIIEPIKESSLSGMTKQELMKYANDPFWIKLRWFLFIAFWLLWAAMLAGAIAIVVLAPKCAPPSPRKWWEESPIVRLSPSDTVANNLNGLESLLDTLSKQHIQAISLRSILKETSPGRIEDFRDFNQNVGSIDDFKKFIKAAADKKQNVILEVDPNHTSDTHPWFNKSINKEEPYTSYYIWADGKRDATTNQLLPPNNLIGMNRGSAWAFDTKRQQYYLSQFNKTRPYLNYNNPAVIKEFSEILKHWSDLGVKGFSLTSTPYLVQDSTNLTNDSISLINVLEEWRETIATHTGNDGLFTLGHGLGHDSLSLLVKNQKIVVDLPQNLHFSFTINSTNSATELNDTINKVLNFANWPGIDVNGNGLILQNQINPNLADNLILMTMLLPATPILQFNDTKSAKSAFAALTEARKSLAFQHGDINTYILGNGTVFVYTRNWIKSGHLGYLVAFNTASQNKTIDVTQVPHLSDKVNVVPHSQNYEEKLSSDNIPLSPKSTLVITFVPK